MGGQQFPINLSGILVAVMLLLAAVLNQPPLRSDRPPAARISAEPSGPFQDIPARIWEDPLEAVARARTPAQDDAAAKAAAPVEAATPGSNVVARYLGHLAQRDLPTRLLLLPVMIPGGPHPALREQRLRMRMALHAGLATGGFLPLRSERIGSWTWTVHPASGSQRTLAVDVPFEVFLHNRVEASGQWVRYLVLVLWLNDEYTSQDLGREAGAVAGGQQWPGPLASIDALLGELGYPTAGQAQPKDPAHWYPLYRSVAVRLLGPASSDSLEPMYLELLGRLGADCGQYYAHLNNDRPGDDATAAAPVAGTPGVAGPGQRIGQSASPSAERAPLLGVFGDAPVNFAVLSPLATAPQRNLVGGDPLPAGTIRIGGDGAKDKQGRPCPRIGFYRTVATDDRLIDALIGELKLRGVDPEGGLGHASRLSAGLARLQALLGNDPGLLGRRDHVVLIWEWDTNFGRTLPTLFEAQVRQRNPDLDPAAPVPWLHQFAYVRGLDGDTPAPPASGTRQAPDVLALATGDEGGFQEPAMGANQYDYLRRMTESIAALDWALQRDNQGSIKAFGILGNDSFDKLLIMQALKERFPGHLYFTTDLDAGLLDARVYRWTRNLVIATPFGLEMGPDLQGFAAPFRHSTQTSLYLSALYAVRGEEQSLARHARLDPPLLFEVGAGRFFRLKTPATAEHQLPPLTPDPQYAQLRPFLTSHASSLLLSIGAALGLLLLMAPAFGRRRRQFYRAAAGLGLWAWGERNAVWLFTVGYLLVGGGWLAVAISAGEEPFAWFAGVSIWPSEIIRVFAGWVACLSLIYGWRRVRDADRRIAERFELQDPAQAAGVPRVPFWAWYRGRTEEAPEPPAPPPEGGSSAGADEAPARPQPPGPLARRVGRLFGDGPGLLDDAAGIDAAREWLRYLPHAAPRARLARVIPMALLFWLLSLVVLYGFVDPLTPHRGLAAWWFDTFGLALLVELPFVLLLFAAVDEARLCRGLLRRIGHGRMHWPLHLETAGVTLDPPSRRAVDYWLSIEFIAERTAPAAHVIHLPLLVTLFLLLSLSTRFDNWNTPATVLGLVGLTVAIVLTASNRLRGTARRIRDRLLEGLKEEVSGGDYAAAETRSDRLRELVKRIEAIDVGAYTRWYNEPVFRALAWVLGIGIWIITEYTKLGG